LIQLGVAEQTRRAIAEATESANRSSRTAFRVALAALALSVIFGLSDYFGDKSWQTDQLRG
jgi:hypothetical protein